MDGDIADIFWDISFKPKEASELNFLVPSYSRSLDGHDGRLGRPITTSLSNDFDASCNEHFSKSFVVSRNTSLVPSSETTVTILESKDDGVMSRLSTELWEAALLLSALLLKHRGILTDIPNARVLELGCGCGLVGLVALDILVASKHEVDSTPYLCFSDYDSVALNLLSEGLQGTQKHLNIEEYDCDKPIPHPAVEVDILHVDWFDYSEDNPWGKRLDNDSFNIIIGSALVYSPSHVAVADLIHFFFSGSCDKAIILQIHDRPGFGLFISRLEKLGLRYSIEEVSEDILADCHRIKETVIQSRADGVRERTLTFNATSIKPVEDKSIPLIYTALSAFRIVTIYKG